MTIFFEPLSDTSGGATGRCLVESRATGFSALGGASAAGGLAQYLRAAGIDEPGGEIIIIVPDAGGVISASEASGECSSHSTDTGNVTQTLRARGYCLSAASSAGELTSWTRARGFESLPPGGYAYLVAQPAIVVSYGGMTYESFAEGLGFTDATTTNVILVFTEVANLRSGLQWIGRLSFTLQSSLTARAVFVAIFEASFAEALIFDDASVDVAVRMIVSLADQLHATGEVSTFADALITVTAAFALRAFVVPGQDLSVESALELVDEATDIVNAIMSMASELDLADEVTPGVTLFATVSEALLLDDDFTPTLDLLLELLDTANFSVRIRLPGHDAGLFVGYAMNVRNAAMAKYDNYPFTDFAVVGGLLMAVGEDGLYELTGDDDAGAPIRSRVRTGLTDFDIELLKRNPVVYLAYTADGSLVLKVINTDGGYKKENWYKLQPRTTVAPTQDRFSIAKGLVGIYWGYEIVNVDGCDFELDAIRSWPLLTNRRKSGR